MSGRTLDQQCTVTRPGVAAIASALLVEILISVLQHPLGALAPAPIKSTEDRGEHPLGIVPHQIRGFLTDFKNVIIRGGNYDCCSACSKKVIDAYRAHGWAFVKRAINDISYVEELSGLAEVSRQLLNLASNRKANHSKVQRAAEKAIAEMEATVEEGFESGEGEML